MAMAVAAPALALWLLALAVASAEGALPPYTEALGESLWKQAQQAVDSLDDTENEAFVCAAGNWGDGPQCDQWDEGRSPCWPSAMTVSASWDIELMARWSLEMAEEFGGANRGQLGPGVNLARFPWNGRLGEYMAGEDPYFGAEMVRAMVTAFRQVEHPPLQTVKHFIPNTIETGRQGMTEVVDERTLFEVYYPPFVAAVEAGVSAVMCSYNLVRCTSGLCSGEAAYACANDDVLNKHLKQAIGFRGIVISDWDATKCDDEAIGSGGCEKKGDYISNAYAASGGLDLEMPACVSFKGGAADRAQEKAARMHWAYMVQGREPMGAGGRRLKKGAAGTLDKKGEKQEEEEEEAEDEEKFCCWWPQPPGDICNQCLKKDTADGYCPKDRRCGGAGRWPEVVRAATTEAPVDEPSELSGEPEPPEQTPEPTQKPTEEPTEEPPEWAADSTTPEGPVTVPRTVAEQPQVPGWALKLAGGRCLEVASERPENGAPLLQRGCAAGSAAQQFTWDSSLSKIHWAAHPALCLDVEDHSFKAGTRLQLWECLEDDDDQVFNISIGPGEGTVRSVEHPRFCLAAGVAGGGSAGIELALCKDATAAQSFRAGRARAPAEWTSVPSPPKPAPAPAPPVPNATTPKPTPKPAPPVPDATTPKPTSKPAPKPKPQLRERTATTTAKAAAAASASTDTPTPATTAAPASASKHDKPSWSTGVYKDNPFGSAAPAPPPPPPSEGEGQGPGCPDDGNHNYKSECKLGLADRIIAESATLIKNEGMVLPLAKGSKVALVGSEACANDPLAQGGGSGWNGFACNEVPKVNVGDGIAGLDGAAAPSCPQKGGSDNDRVGEADVIVAVVAPAKASEGTDRHTLQLEPEDAQLIRKYGELGKKLVVVINAPGPMITSTWDSVVDAILITWLPGQQNGKGIAMALYGEDGAASGRLPFTFPKCSTRDCSREDELASVALGDKILHKEYRNFSEKALIGYRWYHAHGVPVSYPFGFGLFAYGSAVVKYSKARADVGAEAVTISARLDQGGPMEGRDVPQLYLSFPKSIPGDVNSKPEWVLKGFTKVALKPNKSRVVSFALPMRDLSYWDDSPGKSRWVCAKGQFQACVGANARDAVLRGEAACVRFTSPCGKLSDIIAKDEEGAVAAAADRAALAPRFGLVLLSAIFASSLSALALARASWRRRHRTADGFAIIASSAPSADDSQPCESSPGGRIAEEEGLL